MKDVCVEVEHNPAAQAGTLPNVNPGWMPTTTRSKNEENGRLINMTKKMVSEFGATLSCKGCHEIGQPHTQECRARITAKMEQHLAHAQRLEQNATKRLEVVRSWTTCCWKKQPTASGKRPMEPRGDNDMVCGLEVCDGPNECR